MGDEQRVPEASPLAPGLYLVATPIGNLEDITLRALRVLQSVDRIACEDTRQTQKLLNHFDIKTPTVSYHRHNEAGRADELVAELAAGARIAVVSDAGTPGIADPGGLVAVRAIAAGVAVIPIPGANAAISAYAASGLAGGEGEAAQFRFHGFLPAKEGQRRSALEELRAGLDGGRAGTHAGGAETQIFYEAPHRILGTLAEIEAIFGREQPVVVARELTKIHEEFLRGNVGEVREELARRPAVRGEIVLLFARGSRGGEQATTGVGRLGDEVRQTMEREGIAEMEALKRVAKARGLGKSEAYRELQRGRRR